MMSTRTGTTLFYEYQSEKYGTTVMGAIEFDATIAEVHARGATVTEHPVEDGANISDHIRPSLAKLALEVCITNTPLTYVTDGVYPAGKLEDGLMFKVPKSYSNAMLPLVLTGYNQRQVSSARVQGGLSAPYLPPGGANFAKPTPVTATPGSYARTPESHSYTSLQTPTRIDRVKRVFEVLEELCQSGAVVQIQTDLRTYREMVITSLTAPRTILDSMIFGLELTEIKKVKVKSVAVTKRVADRRATAETNKGPAAPVTAIEDKFNFAPETGETLTYTLTAQDRGEGFNPE